MEWQEVLIVYGGCGAAIYVVLILILPGIEAVSPERRIQNQVAEFREKQERRNCPGWRWRFKAASAKFVAHALMLLFVVTAWPLALALKVLGWLSWAKRTDE